VSGENEGSYGRGGDAAPTLIRKDFGLKGDEYTAVILNVARA
jgi:hypothetical protein